MSLPNQEVWGAKTSWVTDPIPQTGGYSGTEALKNIRPMMANFSPEQTVGNRSGCLARGRDIAHVLQFGTSIDETICPCGQDPTVSAYGKIDVFHNKQSAEQNKIPDYENVYENENINWFFHSFVSVNQAMRWGTININSTNQQWAPNGEDISGGIYNNNNYITPWTYFMNKSILLSIYVMTGTSAETYAITLDEWKNNHSNEKIRGAILRINLCTGGSDNQDNFAYGDSQYSYGRALGFSLMNAVNNGSSEIVDYATFDYERQGYIPLITRYIRGNGYDTTTRYYMFGYHNLEDVELKTVWYQGADDGYQIYPEIPYSEFNYEQIMKMAACFGVPFTPTNKLVFNKMFYDEDLYLPIIDENGVTHGEYTHGIANLTNPQYQNDSIRDIDYDPTKPPAPTPSSDPIYPYKPGLTLAGAGTGLWAMTKFGVEEFITDVFGGESKKLKEKLELFGANPMNAVVSLRWYPMVWGGTGVPDGPVVLGTAEVNSSHVYPLIKSDNHSFYKNSGTLDVMKAYDKNFYNSRYITGRLWLPFYGFYELPSTMLLSQQLEVELHYNLPDEVAVWIISFNNVVYDFCECSMGIDIPLTGSNAAAIAETKRQAALSIASQITSTAATAIVGGAALKGAMGAARHLAQGIDALADVGFGWSGGIESEAYLGMRGAGTGWSYGATQVGGMVAGGIGAGLNIANTVHQAKLEIAAMRTNLPFHGAAGQTTFLNLPMYPYVQIIRNNIQSIYNEEEYKLKIGHACDIWTTIDEMPEDSLLQTTGMADMSSMSMELAEAQELNSILQSGFYR